MRKPTAARTETCEGCGAPFQNLGIHLAKAKPCRDRILQQRRELDQLRQLDQQDQQQQAQSSAAAAQLQPAAAPPRTWALQRLVAAAKWQRTGGQGSIDGAQSSGGGAQKRARSDGWGSPAACGRLFLGAGPAGACTRATPFSPMTPALRRSEAGGLWFGKLVALVNTAASPGARAAEGSNLWAFVRWLKNAAETRDSRLLGMTRLCWCEHSRRIDGRRETVPYYDLVQLAAIVGPVCIVPDETPAGSEGVFFYNHFVR